MDSTLRAILSELMACSVELERLRTELNKAPYYCQTCKVLVFGEHRAQLHESAG